MITEPPQTLTTEDQQKIRDWLGVKMQPGRPTCPCGFKGGNRNIRNHRTGCAVWKAYVHHYPKPAKAPSTYDRRSKDKQKAKSRERILLICQRVEEIRGVTAETMFATRRESEKVASARSLAMAACAATGVPICHIARAFQRKWQTIHSAELMASSRYRNSGDYRKEWDKVTAGLDTNNFQPATL